jgi:hypothetical protein
MTEEVKYTQYAPTYAPGAPLTYTTAVPALQQSQYIGSVPVPATSVAPVKGESRIE